MKTPDFNIFVLLIALNFAVTRKITSFHAMEDHLLEENDVIKTFSGVIFTQIVPKQERIGSQNLIATFFAFVLLV